MSICRGIEITSCMRTSKGCIKALKKDIKTNLFIIIGNVHSLSAVMLWVNGL